MKDMKSRLFKTFPMMIAICLALAVSAASVFGADGYPSKPVRLIVPFAPGGTTDIQARVIAPHLSKRLGQQVIVENRGGGGSIIGTEMAAKADPDGYTLILVDVAFTTQPALQKLPYDPMKSFAQIAVVSNATSALIVHPSVPAYSVKEFLALAKQKPGQLIMGTSGMGGGGHFGTSLLQMMANVEFKIVHFKGGGPSMIDLLGGHTNGLLGALSTSYPHIKSGKLRILGTCGLERSIAMPEVPTIAEAGDLPGFEYNSYRGMLAPAGTPPAIINRLTKELKEMLATEEVKKEFLNTGSDVEYHGPAEHARMLEKELAMWAAAAKKANIRME
jgi:tripartite-type tricarboxylate transporter receptor subunit TctC